MDEARDMALLHSARYQQSLRRYQAQRVRRRDLNEGDLVLRLRQDNRGRHKLSPPWEGPYIIAEVLKPGTYKLANEKGEVLTNAWPSKARMRANTEVRPALPSAKSSLPRGLLRGEPSNVPKKSPMFFEIFLSRP